MVTLPAHAVDNNNNNQKVAAATEIIDGHEYAVLNIYQDTYAYAMTAFSMENAYAKIVFQDDWVNNHGYSDPNDDDYTDIEIYNCESLIIDLNGHTCDMLDSAIIMFCPCLRVMDSSAAQTGKIVGCYGIYINNDEEYFPVVSFVLESGTIDLSQEIQLCNGTGVNSVQAHIYDGKVLGGRVRYISRPYCTGKALFHMEGGFVDEVTCDSAVREFQMQLSPYIAGDFTQQGNSRARNLHFAPFEVLPYDYYAVSSSDSLVGAYNYVYGYAWEKNADEMADLTVTADKTYYVWGRTKDGWYHCLEELHYVDGKLVVV